jgi:hypothetical protein
MATETKPSYKTSEAWLLVLAQVFFTLNTAGVWNYMPEKWSGLTQAGVAGAYMLSRGWAKSGVPYMPSAGTAPNPTAPESIVPTK